jgi:arylsulfatase A-like enzyme
LSGNIDLAPTFCDIAGASVPDFVDGRSLLPIFHGNNQADLNWRKEFLVEHFRGSRPKSAQNRPVSTTLDRQFELASYKREDSSEIEEENDEGHAESTARTGSQRGNRRIAPYGLTDPTDWQNKEFGNIPNLHALRSRDGLYVEYITGEREFYRLTEDPDEIDNIASSPKVQNEVSAKHLDLNRLKNAGKN